VHLYLFTPESGWQKSQQHIEFKARGIQANAGVGPRVDSDGFGARLK
jgi:hypothetical protein